MIVPETVRLDDHRIFSIGWVEPGMEHTISILDDEVTKIDVSDQYLGEYSIIWLQVWRGTTLVARYNARNVDNIHYVG